MTSKKPKKRYFTPKKSVDKMTDEELDEFAKFIFDILRSDIEEDGRNNDESTTERKRTSTT
jgi:hypothetical protein